MAARETPHSAATSLNGMHVKPDGKRDWRKAVQKAVQKVVQKVVRKYK